MLITIFVAINIHLFIYFIYLFNLRNMYPFRIRSSNHVVLITKLFHQEEHYWREYSRHKHQLLQAEDEYRSLDSQLRATQCQLEKLKKTNVFNATFHIWHAGHFGTINGFRLGRLPSVPVDWNEVNTAWGRKQFFVSYLLVTWHDESIPPVRKVACTSRHHLGRLLTC
jgi:hypothetical protein